MDRKEAIEIPFGAFDSELKGWEYTIPEGMKARIEGNKVILEPEESEDERIRNRIIGYLKQDIEEHPERKERIEDMLAWLEKQGSQNLANSAKTCKDEQKPAWTEADEDIINRILCICDDFEKSFEMSPSSAKIVKEDIDKIDNYLKALKERYTWKPSDEQMLRLKGIVDSMPHQKELFSLYIDLKKLKG